MIEILFYSSIRVQMFTFVVQEKHPNFVSSKKCYILTDFLNYDWFKAYVKMEKLIHFIYGKLI
jgi:hypothetical protein